MSMRASYTVENVLHYSIPVSNHLLNKAFKLLRYLSLYYLQQSRVLASSWALGDNLSLQGLWKGTNGNN